MEFTGTMKIYTKTGDGGETGLFGGMRVPKNDSRIKILGHLDELNSTIGVAAASIQFAHDTRSINPKDESSFNMIMASLYNTQHLLFDIGACIAIVDSSKIKKPELLNKEISRLEHEIDVFEISQPELKNFILPGGTMEAAHLHQVRTKTRNLEIIFVENSRSTLLGINKYITAEIIPWLNRLSDWLFVSARLTNRIFGFDDVIWNKDRK
jgi:cob(I)alamin adenosyltransferase